MKVKVFLVKVKGHTIGEEREGASEPGAGGRGQLSVLEKACRACAVEPVTLALTLVT